ncbi:hypothetical protein B0H13DRAFT_1969770 [Mycena leptocephala]|nr:hypothetical protein B0H13DRAFT_1969770 [Mycena leptocephala]
MFATSFLNLLLAVSLVSAASLPAARTTTYQICAICPPFDTEGNAVGAIPGGYGLTPPARFCGFGDLGQNGFITKCFYDVRMPLSFATDSYSNYRIPVLSFREQSSALLDQLQLPSHRTAKWLQSRGLSLLIHLNNDR